MTTYSEQAFQGLTDTLANMQTEIMIFAFAIFFHTLVFGKYRILSGAKSDKLKDFPSPPPAKKDASTGGRDTNGRTSQGLAGAQAEAVAAILRLRVARQS